MVLKTIKTWKEKLNKFVRTIKTRIIHKLGGLIIDDLPKRIEIENQTPWETNRVTVLDIHKIFMSVHPPYKKRFESGDDHKKLKKSK